MMGKNTDLLMDLVDCQLSTTLTQGMSTRRWANVEATFFCGHSKVFTSVVKKTLFVASDRWLLVTEMQEQHCQINPLQMLRFFSEGGWEGGGGASPCLRKAESQRK